MTTAFGINLDHGVETTAFTSFKPQGFRPTSSPTVIHCAIRNLFLTAHMCQIEYFVQAAN